MHNVTVTMSLYDNMIALSIIIVMFGIIIISISVTINVVIVEMLQVPV